MVTVPISPNSSPTRASTKSVCASGKKNNFCFPSPSPHTERAAAAERQKGLMDLISGTGRILGPIQIFDHSSTPIRRPQNQGRHRRQRTERQEAQVFDSRPCQEQHRHDHQAHHHDRSQIGLQQNQAAQQPQHDQRR
jgi:hypothetical protein